MTTNDRRYTVNREYTGAAQARYVARFCGEWISSHATAEEARRACNRHQESRTIITATTRRDQYTPPLTPEQARAHTARRKLAKCIKLARESRRDSWQEPTTQRSEYHRISREALEDARYWRDEIRKLDNQEPDR